MAIVSLGVPKFEPKRNDYVVTYSEYLCNTTNKNSIRSASSAVMYSQPAMVAVDKWGVAICSDLKHKDGAKYPTL